MPIRRAQSVLYVYGAGTDFTISVSGRTTSGQYVGSTRRVTSPSTTAWPNSTVTVASGHITSVRLG